eukprot:CAMPEP_0176345466 /NCGR_PEP_ID=MMETSP0126-20121128/5473_1 /TAXON_ID=141414 ORGANISM="Strombidinopsis acuminatum, Strain SPMC142" /NCGR_SAMPLE_ID=MMETSP0126 /ASSEMBLY_ACC=CAM_ASM_000229 /LENGTH=76 /DNA_ID=CAMNT_0017692445 /DNA_START=261 /DNA_END=491 /DNA_ORIENTATION=+
MSGECEFYNNVDDVWRFNVRKLEIKGESFKLASPHCQVISLDGSNNPVEGQTQQRQIRRAKKGKGKGGMGRRTNQN